MGSIFHSAVGSRKRQRKALRFAAGFGAALGMVLLLSACGGNRPTSFVHPRVDFSFFKKVAVLPFQNLTTDQFAPERVRESVSAELLATGAMDVVEPGQVLLVMRQLNLQPGVPLGVADLKKLGKALGVNGVIMGTVKEYGEVRSGSVSAPVVSLSLRMIEVDSGAIVWSVSNTAGGISTTMRLFGIGSSTMSEVTRTAVRQSLDTLFR